MGSLRSKWKMASSENTQVVIVVGGLSAVPLLEIESRGRSETAQSVFESSGATAAESAVASSPLSDSPRIATA